MLLNCCRQSGKSTIAALLATWTALYTPRSLTLLLSPSLRQSAELFRKTAFFLQALKLDIGIEAQSVLRVEFSNGSRVVSLPGTDGTVRGYSAVDLLICDEATRVDDLLYRAVRPMLAVSGGKLAALTTPYGARGWFYDAWRGGEDWHRFEIPARDCPRIPETFLAEERRVLPPWSFASEYECQFTDTDLNVFSSDDVEAALASIESYSFEDLLK